MIQNIYSLSINDDRYNYQCEIFKSRGLPIPFKYKGFKNCEKKEKCCLFGHMSIIMMARCLNFPYVFIVEDDAYPRKDVVDRLNFYIQNKPYNCGILVVGRNGESGNITQYDKDYHIVHQRPFGAHSYIVYKECYDSLLKSMENVRIADIALKCDNFKDYIPYWTNDNLFIQKNIDNNCMSKHLVDKYGNYFYPKENGCLGVFCSPPDNIMW
jgi:GR25 family glycosyltransferase involved in LPS biosynthesis